MKVFRIFTLISEELGLFVEWRKFIMGLSVVLKENVLPTSTSFSQAIVMTQSL